MTIYKYPLRITDFQIVEIPKPYTILSVDTQRGIPCIWAMCASTWGGNKTPIKVCIIGTGNPVPKEVERMAFLGTFLVADGDFVGHVFWEEMK